LRHVNSDEPGIARARTRLGVRFLAPDGKVIDDTCQVDRIRALAIPPAWKSVWICADDRGHIQATGRDARGRKQYIYHRDFRAHRDADKFGHVIGFAEALPALRRRVRQDLGSRVLSREKVIAAVVDLLELTLIRVGNDEYARANGSFGLTTLRDRHVAINGSNLRFIFTGKSGKEWRVTVRDRRLARVVKACQDLPGQRLFQYVDEAGERRSVTSTDVNAYLREATGRDVTAKDFRTWAASVLAARRFHELGVDGPPPKVVLKALLAEVAARLGNTPTICRKSYIHPEILRQCERGASVLCGSTSRTMAGLSAEENKVLRFLKAAGRKTARTASPHRPAAYTQ
jgi:DNA topoisomerase-1